MDLYSQPTQPNMIKLYNKQKFIHWATRGRLNNHCNKGLKQRRTATSFLHTSAILAWSAFIISELYMAVHTIEW